MPWPFRRTSPAPVAPEHPGDRRATLLLEGLRDLAGLARGVVYDVPHAQRPRPRRGGIFLRDSDPWRRFLNAREAVDTGQPALLIALRVLDEGERRLAVDWGTTYANAFLLVEPHDWRCDLTDPENPFRRRLDAAVEATLPPAGGAAMVSGWTRGTPLGALLRELYGVWRHWTVPSRRGASRGVALHLVPAGDTLWQRLLPVMHERFPPAAFDRALHRLRLSDRELLVGPVARARSVFRTRLGLPVPGDPRAVDRAVRRLVDAGKLRVLAPALPGRPVFGGGQPVPPDITDEEFATFVMI